MEILDYLAWRKDVPLSLSPFNKLDKVIHAYLSYIEFKKPSGREKGFKSASLKAGGFF